MERLLQEQFAVVAGGQADEPDLVRQILRHLERARADGTGGTKKDDLFHDISAGRGAPLPGRSQAQWTGKPAPAQHTCFFASAAVLHSKS
jgi:hypothetical protein